jgi:hypothetical protein
MKESKSDVSIEQLNTSSANPNNLQTLPPEQIQVKQNMSESVDNVVQQHTIPLITPVQQPVVPVIAQIPPYNIPVQQPSYLINPHSQIQSTEAIELTNQQIVPALNGKDDSVEKVSKGSTVLGKTQAKKRLMAFSMMKQKLQEQNNSMNDNQNSDIGEGNDVEFMPELNVFQTVTKKKVLTNKKGRCLFSYLLIFKLYFLLIYGFHYHLHPNKIYYESNYSYFTIYIGLLRSVFALTFIYSDNIIITVKFKILVCVVIIFLLKY